MYVCIEDSNEEISIYYELSALMKIIKLPVAKWPTSCEELTEIWKAECQEIQRTTQTLGVDWNTETDTPSVDPRDILNKTTQGPATKRQLLQIVARFYDPLGLFSPVSAIAQILFLETWFRGIQWDESVPHVIGASWHAWITPLPLLAGIHIPRWMETSNDHDTQIHIFCDASEMVYGAVLYGRSSTHEGTVVRLACSRNRLAPVKKTTLPPLDFLAALVGARLLQYFCRETDLDIGDTTVWTDTTVALS
jgi:hypothetical protein